MRYHISSIKYLVFGLILLIAILFRLYRLDEVPPHASLDEVSIGYNAYSILQTGRDEYGQKFPILLRAYDDWRPALYVYFVIPFVKLFGLNIFAVRFPSVILSILTVCATYFLVKELLKRPNIALLTSFFLAISPWHIYFSRIGHEWNGTLSFFVLGLLFFIRFVNAIKSNVKGFAKCDLYFILSTLFFATSFNFYQSSKIFVPIFLLTLLSLFYKELLRRKKILLVSILLGFFAILPVFVSSTSSNALIRFQGTNIFSQQWSLFERSAFRLQEDMQTNNFLGMLFDNRRLLYFLIPVHTYLSHFNYAWLFTNGGADIFKVPDFGLFYLFELPLFILGLIFFVKVTDISKRSKLVILFWILTAILPAAITSEYPHAARIYNVLPAPQIIAAAGFYFFITQLLSIRNYLVKNISIYAIVGVILFSVLWFYHAYFVNFRRELSNQFQYGVIESLSYADSISDRYDNVVVSNKNNLFQSYMFYLFLKKFDPFEYQKLGGTGSGGFDVPHKIGTFEFTKPTMSSERNTLYVINPSEFPEENINILQRMRFLDGKDAVWISERK